MKYTLQRQHITIGDGHTSIWYVGNSHNWYFQSEVKSKARLVLLLMNLSVITPRTFGKC